MENSIDFFSMFFSFLLAFIVKDFYDIFLSSRIRNLFKKYHIVITKNNKK
jgi:hypothetical protein